MLDYCMQKYLQFAIAVDPGKDIGYDPKITDANTGMQGLLNAVYLAAGMVAVLVIVIAGFIYVTSRGDANRVKQARNAIVAALVGVVIIMSAFIITQYIIFGVTR